MNLWLLIIGALTLQEGLSTTVILLEAVHAHYPLILVHVIWLLVTVLQIVIGYLLGKWVQKRFGNSKAEQWFKKSAEKLEKSIGRQGAELALVIASAVVSPAATSFLASWLDLSFTKIFIFSLLGDFLWYLSEWVTVYGATQILADAKYGLAILFVIAVAWIAFTRLRPSSHLP